MAYLFVRQDAVFVSITRLLLTLDISHN
uniref:Uncharacterized protein n=1 Tax=Arundo donax TaxID=35708 RepID=A0A0A8YM12_ARUDO